MIDPQHLIELAREQIDGLGAGAPRQVVLRRTISTAYYAVFHALLGTTARTFVPQNQRKSRVLFYRSLDHGKTRERCKKLSRDPLPSTEKDFFGFAAFPDGLRSFADTFVILQELRFLSDYDPDTAFSKPEAQQAIDQAAQATALLDEADPKQRIAFLAYLLFGIRAQ